MRVIKTQVPPRIICADGGHWMCTCVNNDGEQFETWAPIRSPAWLLKQVTDLAIPILEQEEHMRRADSAASYEVAIGGKRERGNIG